MVEQVAAAQTVSRAHFGQQSTMHFLHEGGEKETATSWPSVHWSKTVFAQPWTQQHMKKFLKAEKEESEEEEQEINSMDEVD